MTDIDKMFVESKKYRRVDATHRYNIYMGNDNYNKKSLAILGYDKINKINSSKEITVEFVKRMNGDYKLSFSLEDLTKQDIFYLFCNDIVENTRNIEIDNILNFVNNRWNLWMDVFNKSKNKYLNEKEIRGLIGELVFIKDHMFKKYSVNDSITSWQGCEQAHKDFEIEDTWYECKCIGEAARSVKISSIEQLDSNKEGYLYISKISPSNNTVHNAITLNSLFKDIVDKVKDDSTLNLFLSKLTLIGYVEDDYYDQFIYEKKNEDFYKVSESFPRIKENILAEGIINVSYTLLLRNINDFRCEYGI